MQLTETRITLSRPDDWHLHLRDGAILSAVLPATASVFGRAIIMPNLRPPIRTSAEAAAYRERILAALPAGTGFEPLMTVYLTEATDPTDLVAGHQDGIVTAVKLYPAGATTNSDMGVKDMGAVRPVLEAMEKAGIPLLIHGEVTDPTVDIFDREAVFVDRVLIPLRREHPGLKVVLEHVTTEDGAAYVAEAEGQIGATLTPHHLIVNRNALFQGGLRPHMYCLPIVKRERHRLALRKAATSGSGRFFLGTDSAPHPVHLKEADCGCAGVYNAPGALEWYASVFEEEGALDRLEAFASLDGPAFYGLPASRETVILERGAPELPETITAGEDEIRVFDPDRKPAWRVV